MLFADVVSEIANDSGKKLFTGALVAIISAVASFLIGRYWGRYQANQQWQKKEFLDRIIISLNIFADETLKIRTVMERSLEHVFLNRIAIDKVLAAARNCTADQPILPISKEDRWYLLNFVLNSVAEHFAAGHVKQDAGVAVVKIKYVLFLTSELLGDERLRKIRAMMIRQEHLENFPYHDDMPKLESPLHADRIKTLKLAVDLYKREPDNFLVMEVCV